MKILYIYNTTGEAAEMSRLEALAVGKACCAISIICSRLRKREPWTALGCLPQGGLHFYVRSTPLWDRPEGKVSCKEQNKRPTNNNAVHHAPHRNSKSNHGHKTCKGRRSRRRRRVSVLVGPNKAFLWLSKDPVVPISSLPI